MFRLRDSIILWRLFTCSAISSVYFYYLCLQWTTTNEIDDQVVRQVSVANMPNSLDNKEQSDDNLIVKQGENDVVIGCVICGHEHLEEALVMVKSAIIFQNGCNLRFIMISELKLQTELYNELKILQVKSQNSFSFQVLNTSFPYSSVGNWYALEERLPCASQRLFIPDLLTDVTNILYIDTDIIFLNPITYIWQQLLSLNYGKLCTMSRNSEYAYFLTLPRDPYRPAFGARGLNSGVIFMNLTKMRDFQWVSYLEPIYERYKSNLKYGDQGILTAFFHFFPDMLTILPCNLNYRRNHCKNWNHCKAAESEGVSLLHGAGDNYHITDDEFNPFRIVYLLFRAYELETDVRSSLFQPIINEITWANKTVDSFQCADKVDMILQNIRKALIESHV